MDYKQQVINSADQKHQDLLSGKTEPVIRTDLKLESSLPYSQNRDQFAKRTEQERKAFNRAIDIVKENGKARDRDKDVFKGVVITAVIFYLLFVLIIGALLSGEGFREWVNNSILESSGKSIGDALSGEAEGLVGIICVGLSGLVGVVLFFVCMFTLEIDSCLGKLIASAIVGALSSAILQVVLRVLVFLGGYLLFYLLQPLGLIGLGLVGMIIMLAVGRNLDSQKYKRLKLILSLSSVGLAAITSVISLI